MKQIVKGKRVRIYTLKDNSGVRYVGKTVQALEDRLHSHCLKAKKRRRTPKDLWLAALLNKGELPSIEIVESVPAAKAGEAERSWIEYFEQLGAKLVNSAPGGAGGSFRRKVDWTIYEYSLGQIPDAELAESAGVTRKAVTYQRHKRKIPPCGNREERRSPPPPMAGHNKILLPASIIERLGKMPDCELAKMAGVSKSRIMDARHKRGIMSYAERNGYPTRFDGVGLHPRWHTPMEGGD